MSLPKTLITRLLEKHSEKEIESISQFIAKTQVKDIVLLLREKFDINSFLDVVENWLRVSNYPYQHQVDNKIHKFVIQHDMGKKWSLFLSENWKTVFEELGVPMKNVDLTDNILMFTIDSDAMNTRQ